MSFQWKAEPNEDERVHKGWSTGPGGCISRVQTSHALPLSAPESQPHSANLEFCPYSCVFCVPQTTATLDEKTG
jgi:hypothetical protein